MTTTTNDDSFTQGYNDARAEILDYIRTSRGESMGLGDAAIINGIIANCGGKPLDFTADAIAEASREAAVGGPRQGDYLSAPMPGEIDHG